MIDKRILGTWVYTVEEEGRSILEGHSILDYAHFTDQGRLIGFTLWPPKFLKYVPTRTWYEVLHEGLLRLKLKPTGTTWNSSYYFEDDKLIIIGPSENKSILSKPDSALPEWFPNELQKAINHMIEKEKAEQGA